MTRSYDEKCEELAAYFLSNSPNASATDRMSLAQSIQDAVENWFSYDGPTDDQIANGPGIEGGVRYGNAR